MTMIRTETLSKVYGSGEAAVTALDGVSLSVEQGEFVAVMGPSGCGKSTLLHLLGGLDRPTGGKAFVDGAELSAMGDRELSRMRRRRIGFVFQFYNLIPVLDAAENAALPLLLDGKPSAASRNAAVAWLERLGLDGRAGSRPVHLSADQQQRVAGARALAGAPALLLADEPTGNLDTRSADDLASLLKRVSSEYGRTVVMVTHDPRIAAYADRRVFRRDGKVSDETVFETRAAGGKS